MHRLKKLVTEKQLIATGGIIATYLVDPATVDDPADLRSEIAMPVFLMGAPPELPEGVEIRQVPALHVAAMAVKGEYGTVEAAAIPKVAVWMAENGHGFAGAPRMVYLHDAESTVPEDQVSEVQIPVAK
jgi:effector-binding domain-containing protein